MANCPWGGLPCDCTEFPWLKDGLVPLKCELRMPEALLGLRKVSEAGKMRYYEYLASIGTNPVRGGATQKEIGHEKQQSLPKGKSRIKNVETAEGGSESALQ